MHLYLLRLRLHLIRCLLGFAILALFSCYQGHAQSFGEAGSYGSKPSVGLSGEANTNFATGLIAPSIPLLSLPGVAGGISIGLQYQAGAGVKVNAIASEVGLGWALSGGGAIVRDVRGFPDDSDHGWIIVLPNNSYRNIYFQPGVNLHSFPLNSSGDVVKYFKARGGNFEPGAHFGAGTYENNNFLTWLYPASQVASYGQYTLSNTYVPYGQPNSPNNSIARFSGVFLPDNEPDIYTLTLPSGSLQFVLDPSGNPVPLQAQNIKIEALDLTTRTYNINGLLHEFLVTTSDGVKYYFGSAAGSTTCKEHVAVTTRVLEINGLGSKGDLGSFINKWHLRQIVYPSGETIDYTYSVGKNYEVSTNNYLQQDWVFTAIDGSRFYNCQSCPDWGHAWHTRDWQRRYTIRTSMASTDTKQLASITSVQGALQFSYQSAPRKDVGGTTNALSTIRLLNAHGDLIKQLDLVQHYAVYVPKIPKVMLYDRYHLLLDRIIDRGTGCDYTNLWQFGYDPHTFCRNAATKDYWGYLNGLTYPADSTLVAPYARGLMYTNYYALSGRSRDPDAGFTQYMILQSITAATGAVQSFSYQLNDGSFGNGSTNDIRPVGGLRIYRISKFDGIDHSNDIVDEFAYRKATNANESSGVLGEFGMYAKLQLIHDDLDRSRGSAPGQFVIPDASLRSMLPSCCTNGDSNHSRADYYYMLRSDASMYEYASDYIDYSCVTVSHSTNGTKGKTRYEFTSWEDTAHQDYTDPDTREVGNNLNTCPADPLNPAYRGDVLPLPFSLEVDGLQLRSSLTYYGNPVLTQGISADFPRRSSRSAERGLPLLVTQLTNSNVAVAATINEYDFSRSSFISPTVRNPITLPSVNAVYVKPSFETFGFSQYFTYFQLYYYNIDSQWCPLINTTEIVYSQNSGGALTNSVATKTLIEYENFFPSKVTKYTTTCSSLTATACQTAALGQYQVTEFRRAQSSNFPDGIASGNADLVTTPALLRTAGMTAPVIEQRQYTTATLTGTPTNHLGASLTLFRRDNNGHVIPYETYASPAGTSFTPATTAYTPAQPSGGNWTLTKDGSYKLVSTVNGYTAEALPVNTIGRDGIPQATIWGYGHTMPIAMVTNGIAATGSSGDGLVATSGHTSFEETGTDGDNWSVPAHYSTEAKTGAQSARYVLSESIFGLNKRVLIPPANQQGKLLFSCWAKVPTGNSTSVLFKLVAASPTPQNGYMQSPDFQVLPGEDWKYCEFAIDLTDPTWGNLRATNQNLSLLHYIWMLNGNQLLLDEVRLHPADAQMQTVTYRPLVGKTSSTGSDSRTTYFTYNSDNSPNLVLNHNRDVLTRFQSKAINQVSLNADFTGPDHGYTQTALTFLAELNGCTDGTNFIWDFGDGTAPTRGLATQQSHLFSSTGTYQVTLITSNTKKGVAKATKSVTICDGSYVQLYITQGDVYVDYCYAYEPVILEANVTNDCSAPASLQWQTQTVGSNAPWVNVPAANYGTPGYYYIFNVPCTGSVNVRCLVTYADGTTSENRQDIITGTGIVSSAGCMCPPQ